MNRLRTSSKRSAVVMAVLLSVNASGFSTAVNAGIISTQAALAQRDARMEQIDAFLGREDVAARFVALGVDPAEARERVQALSEEEIAQIAERLDNLPAGGNALAIIGATFLVLLILELVGVINVFNKL